MTYRIKQKSLYVPHLHIIVVQNLYQVCFSIFGIFFKTFPSVAMSSLEAIVLHFQKK